MRLLKEISAAQGRVTYGLTEASFAGVPTYGITVSTSLFGDEETERVDHIAAQRDFTEKLFYLLADNIVLPSTMTEVIEEYVTASMTA